MILAQRVPLPVMGHQDAAQVPMAGEADAVHVEDLPLVPGGRREDRRHTGQFGEIAGQLGLDADIAGLVEGEQVVVEGEVTVFFPLPTAGVVDRRNILQALE